MHALEPRCSNPSIAEEGTSQGLIFHYSSDWNCFHFVEIEDCCFSGRILPKGHQVLGAYLVDAACTGLSYRPILEEACLEDMRLLPYLEEAYGEDILAYPSTSTEASSSSEEGSLEEDRHASDHSIDSGCLCTSPKEVLEGCLATLFAEASTGEVACPSSSIEEASCWDFSPYMVDDLGTSPKDSYPAT